MAPILTIVPDLRATVKSLNHFSHGSYRCRQYDVTTVHVDTIERPASAHSGHIRPPSS